MKCGWVNGRFLAREFVYLVGARLCDGARGWDKTDGVATLLEGGVDEVTL